MRRTPTTDTSRPRIRDRNLCFRLIRSYLGVCVYCGYCVEVCPEDAIRMDTGILDLAAYSREAMRLDIHELMDPKLRKPITDCGLKFPHTCKVTGEEMKGSWESVGGS